MTLTRTWLMALALALASAFHGSRARAAEPSGDAGGADFLLVEVKRKPSDKTWVKRETRTLAHVKDFKPAAVQLSRFGGRLDRKVKATGFFHVLRDGGRWWLVDPEGGLALTIGVCSVRRSSTAGGQAALKETFGPPENWAQRTSDLLWENGYNGLACWATWEEFRDTKRRLPYTVQWNFMSGYGKRRGGTYQKPGHTGYPGDCIFVFDPEFETFCDEHAKKLAATKDDASLLGHFSDNEMPLPTDALDRYLKLPAQDPGHAAARRWLAERRKTTPADKISDEEREAFLEHLSARYFRIVSQAIKKYDPNHLYFGPRLHGGALRRRAIFKGCAPYVDVIALNYYGAWTPDPKLMANWIEWSGRPFIITEWYAKGADSGMANNTGAGWLVKTQADRGRFYQNFTLGLLEQPGCVGWHWFKYMDNDPANRGADPSNLNSNKGFVDNRYRPYPELLKAMHDLNVAAYALADHFLRQAQKRESN